MKSTSQNTRRGIACAGNWIVDHVKIVDVWPSPGYLSNILAEERGTGGAPFNVLVDIAVLDASIPLEAIGLVGNDNDGQWIRELIQPLASEMCGLIVSNQSPTSYTDVITVKETGQRTFFHMRGANAHFDVDHVNVDALQAKIFHLGYMFLLDTLDQPDPEFGSRAARLLAKVRKAGIITSIDMVSAEESRYAEIVIPALKHTDYCIINELEAQAVTGFKARGVDNAPDWDAIKNAAKKLADLGTTRLAAIHLPEGAVAYDVACEKTYHTASTCLPQGFIKGTAGAGDAFCAGMLLGLHEGWPIETCLGLGHASATASLRHPTCTQGMASYAEVMALVDGLKG